MIKPCQRCGQPFDAFSGTAKYCVTCRDEARREYWRRRYHEQSDYRNRRRQSFRRWYEAHREQNLERFHRRYIKSKLKVLRGEKSA